MRKLAFAFVLASLPWMPSASGASGTGCAGFTASVDPASESFGCSYTSTGGDRYLVLTPNAWTITVKRGATVVHTIHGAAGDPSTPPAGELTASPGDRVTLTVSSSCGTPAGCATGAAYFIGSPPSAQGLP